MKLYCVKDTVSGIYQSNPIVSFHNDAEAKRWFDQACKNTPTAPDLQLIYLCEFDELSGTLAQDDSDFAIFHPSFICGYSPDVKE